MLPVTYRQARVLLNSCTIDDKAVPKSNSNDSQVFNQHCKYCRLDEKQRYKDTLRRAEEEQNDKLRCEQERLFQEARSASSGSSFAPQFDYYSINEVQARRDAFNYLGCQADE